MDLSVIIPFAGEYPLILPTIASVHDDLRGRGIDYEIVAVDNDCPEWRAQIDNCATPEPGGTNQLTDKGLSRSGATLVAAAAESPWLKVVAYRDRLSHWQAKNVGVAASTGRILWFCDAHCLVPRGVMETMFRFYDAHREDLNGSLHLPTTYTLLSDKPLRYRLVPDLDHGWIGYTNTPHIPQESTFEVPCASSCGMMTTRKLFDDLGGFPQRHAYSGGEHFWNFVLAVTGRKKWMFSGGYLRHHGAPRNYHYTYDGMVWNRCAAMLMVGGQALAQKYIDNVKGDARNNARILSDVLTACAGQRTKIKAQQVVDIAEWAARWAQ